MTRTVFLHRALLGGNLTLAFAGLAFGGDTGITLNVIIFLFLLVALRVKFWYDDEQYFEDVRLGKHAGGVPFFVGTTFAVITWVLWMLAAFFIKKLDLAALLMAITIGVSTLWIVAAMVKRGAYAEQVPWLFFNAFYILGFLLIWFRGEEWNPFRNSAETYTLVVVVGLIAVFLVDLVTTRILEQKRLAGTPNGAA